MRELQRLCGLSAAHLRRLAHAEEIPGTIRPKRPGGHFTFRDCPALRAWAANMLATRATGGGRTRTRALPVERNDGGTFSPLEVARQFDRDCQAILRTAPPRVIAEVARILRPRIHDLLRLAPEVLNAKGASSDARALGLS